ncbi:MAG TPA: Gfo/Idh/MocA family oxidoreductase, partial [Fimbriiglobus sp.]|nr:Gfo/Idh/MocA family oxidoreductase [Fimbriiglobus sp.]
MTAEPTRRSFLLATGATVAGSVARGYPANETLTVGVIGSGGRARHLMGSLPKIENVRIIAVCDVWDAALAEGRKLADPKAAATKKYQELLDRKDVQAVLIGTPDHWHVPLTVAACEAGKDVYVEKPLTHDLSEGRAVRDAQAKS